MPNNNTVLKMENSNREAFTKPDLYSAWYCPFAQRAWLALLHKGVDFNYIETDPYLKTEQWLNISRQTGQVPVLTMSDNNAVVGSSRAVEFVDQLESSSTALFSANPIEAAEQKYWVDYVSDKIIPYFYRYLKNSINSSTGQQAQYEMLKGLSEFTQAMSKDGPFFSGEKISAVDIAFIPFAYRIELLLSHYRDFSLPNTGDNWPRYQQWYQANIEDTLYKLTSTVNPDYEAKLIEFYLPYSQGGGQEDVTKL